MGITSHDLRATFTKLYVPHSVHLIYMAVQSPPGPVTLLAPTRARNLTRASSNTAGGICSFSCCSSSLQLIPAALASDSSVILFLGCCRSAARNTACIRQNSRSCHAARRWEISERLRAGPSLRGWRWPGAGSGERGTHLGPLALQRSPDPLWRPRSDSEGRTQKIGSAWEGGQHQGS